MEKNSVYLDMIAPRLQKLGEANITQTTRSNVARQVETAKSVTANAQKLIDAIKADRNLSREGKRERFDTVLSDAKPKLEAAQREITRQLDLETRFWEERAAWPRSAGPDADREGRLANARADFDRVMANVGPGQRSSRLSFIARNGSDSARELLFVENYVERVYFPSLNDAPGDAAAWAEERPNLIKELHPRRGEAGRALDALEALNREGRQIQTIANVAVQTAIQVLSEAAQHA